MMERARSDESETPTDEAVSVKVESKTGSEAVLGIWRWSIVGSCLLLMGGVLFLLCPLLHFRAHHDAVLLLMPRIPSALLLLMIEAQ